MRLRTNETIDGGAGGGRQGGHSFAKSTILDLDCNMVVSSWSKQVGGVGGKNIKLESQ